MRVTRDMYAGDCDVYTDLLHITARSLGVSPFAGSLGDELEHYQKVGWCFADAVDELRTRLEFRVHKVLKGAAHG